MSPPFPLGRDVLGHNAGSEHTSPSRHYVLGHTLPRKSERLDRSLASHLMPSIARLMR